MNRKLMTVVMATLALFSLLAVPQGAVAGPGHNIFILGRSTFVGDPCQYVWADTDGNSVNGTQPDRDAVGIPRPSTLPPTCRDSNNNPNDGIQPVACELTRNLGPYPPGDRAPNPFQGEVGINPPCYGNLSATDVNGPQGCVDAGTSIACDLQAPTWFYGYCGQTYGGAATGSITLHAQQETWNITAMGFPRGRGIWEFNGRAERPGQVVYLRLYLGAVPDQPNQLLGCDATRNIRSIFFTGTIHLTPSRLPRALAPQRAVPAGSGHWNYCDDSPAADGPLYDC